MADPAVPRFQELQYQFARHLRDPQSHAAPAGLEDRRLKIYRELFYNNIEGFLANGFPVLRRITPDARWHAMARDFFARHRCHEPQFFRIAEEFVRYLDAGRGDVAGDWPFLRELAHYEWAELALSIAPDTQTRTLADADGDLLSGVPVLSPLAWTLAYDYPVHRIGPDFLPGAPAPRPTYLVVYRTRQDDVKFLEINAVTARLIELLEAGPAPGRELLRRIAAELGQVDPDALVATGAEMLRGLRARDIILGTRR